jgi:DeoR family transcriptional regulator of aga operon
MLTIERQRDILRYLAGSEVARVRSLAQTLGVSVSTIRRDLDDMAASGVVRRVHGGVVLIAGEELRAEGVMIERAVANTAAKGRIAAAAARLVTPGSTIFVSGGTTTERLVPHLAGVASLTVITNAVNVAHLLAGLPGVEAIVLGGYLRHSELTLLGAMTEQAVRMFRIETAFYGCYGIDAATGITGASLQEAATDHVVIAAADRLVVLADGSKFAQSGPVRLAETSGIDTLVTTDPPAGQFQQLERAGVSVVLA